MKANSPSQSPTSIDKVKTAMRNAGIGFMEIDDYMVIKRNWNLVSFNPMTSDDDAILLAKIAGISIRSVGDIGFDFIYESHSDVDRIDAERIKSLKVNERFFIRKRIIDLINEFGANKRSNDIFHRRVDIFHAVGIDR